MNKEAVPRVRFLIISDQVRNDNRRLLGQSLYSL